MGVSVEFFTKSIKALEKLHGPRNCGPTIEMFRAALEEAESLYQGLPPKEAKKSTRKKESKSE